MLLRNKLEELLKSHWTEILDRNLLMAQVLITVQNTNYKTGGRGNFQKQTKISITKFTVDGDEFEIWVEFLTPKDEGVIIGTQIYSLRLNGELHLKQSYGTEFLPEIK